MDNAREQPPPPTLKAQAAYFTRRFKATLYTVCEGRQALNNLTREKRTNPNQTTTWSTDTARRKAPQTTFPKSQTQDLINQSATIPESNATKGVDRPPNNFNTLTEQPKVTKTKLIHPKPPANLPIPPPNTLRSLIQEHIEQENTQTLGDGIAVFLTKSDLRRTKLLPLINITRRAIQGTVIFTDGSRKPPDPQTGRAALIIKPDGSVIVHLGATNPGSSGLQEVLAARDALYITQKKKLPTPAIIITDYLSLANTKWKEQVLKQWRNSRIPGAWQHITDLLKTTETSFHHIRSHQTQNKSLLHHLNDQVDGAAKLALQCCTDGEPTIPLSQEPAHRPIPRLTKAQAMQRFTREITLAELNITIQSLKTDGAHDSTGLSPKCLKALDARNRETFREILEEVRKTGNVPPSWKIHKLILLWKHKFPAEDPKTWRPITIQHACLNTLTRILAQRLLELLWHLEIIPKSQKCNIAGVAGVQQHVATLAALIYDAWHKARTGKPCTLTIILTDIAKAFDSVQRGVIIATLEHILGPEANTFTQIVKNLYTNVWIVLTDGDDQYKLPKNAALNQGDALSPIIFILILLLVREAMPVHEHTAHRLQFQPTTPITELGYADDIADIIASTNIERIDDFQKCLQKLHMTINPEKTQALILTKDPKRRNLIASQKQINIDGTPIQTLPASTPWKYLGTWFSGDMNHWTVTKPAIQRYIDTLQKIQLLPLHAQGKLDFAKTARQQLAATFSHPAWDMHNLFALETHERTALAHILQTPKLPVAFCTAPLQIGGLGHTLFRDLHRQALVQTFISMLWSHDQRVQNACLNMITSTQQYLKIPKGTKKVPFFQWANIPRRTSGSPKKFPWATIEYAMAAHMLHISLEIRKDNKLYVTLKDPHIGSEIPIHNTQQLNQWIATARRKKYLKWTRGCYTIKHIDIEEKEIANEEFEGPFKLPRIYKHTKTRIAYLPQCMATAARAFLRPQSTRNNVGDILQCQLGTLYTNLLRATYAKTEVSNKCNWCNYIETVGHVLSPPNPSDPHNPHPKSSCSLTMERHEQAVREITHKLISIPDIKMYDKDLPLNNRPDIILTHNKLNKILIIDITYCDDKYTLTLQEQIWKDIKNNADLWDVKGVRIPAKYKQTQILQNSDGRRIISEALQYCPPARYYNRYKKLQTLIQQNHPDHTVDIFPIIAGVTGSAVHKSITATTDYLQLPKQINDNIMRILANAAIRAIPKILRGWRLQRSLNKQKKKKKKIGKSTIWKIHTIHHF